MIFDSIIQEPTFLGLLVVVLICNIIYFGGKIIEYYFKNKDKRGFRFILKENYRFIMLLGFLIVITLIPFSVIPTTPNNIVYIQTNNTYCFGCNEFHDPTILILMGVLIPIVILVSIIVRYFPKKKVQVN